MNKQEFNSDAQLLARHCPKTWQTINRKRYHVPDYRRADYANQIGLINEFASDLCSMLARRETERSTIYINACLALAHDRQTYFLERELGEALCRTELPNQIEPEIIKWRFPQLRVMLPLGLLSLSLDDGRIAVIRYLDIFRIDPNKIIGFLSEIQKELDTCGTMTRPGWQTWRIKTQADLSLGVCSITEDPARALYTHRTWSDIDGAKINQAMNLEGSYRVGEE
jgi:hypothetical protein